MQSMFVFFVFFMCVCAIDFPFSFFRGPSVCG